MLLLSISCSKTSAITAIAATCAGHSLQFAGDDADATLAPDRQLILRHAFRCDCDRGTAAGIGTDFAENAAGQCFKSGRNRSVFQDVGAARDTNDRGCITVAQVDALLTAIRFGELEGAVAHAVAIFVYTDNLYRAFDVGIGIATAGVGGSSENAIVVAAAARVVPTTAESGVAGGEGAVGTGRSAGAV